MRYLIDGYNVMFAGGLLTHGKALKADGLRKVRQRFLNDLADALGPIDAQAATVVFDASQAPDNVPRRTPHKGLTVVYAVEDDADTQIEQLLAKHSHPKALSVVSSDRRLRQAASRRRARPVTSEDFWAELDARKRRRSQPEPPPKPTPAPPSPSADADHWLEVFAEVDAMPETREALAPDSVMLTDAEIARLEREIEREFRGPSGEPPLPPHRPGRRN